MGSRGLPTERSFTTTPFRSLENAPFFESLPLKEPKDYELWVSFQEILKFLSCIRSKDITFLIDSGSFSNISESESSFP